MADSGFDVMHEAFVKAHLAGRQGEARRRLEQGHAHGERAFLELVWYPVFQHLDGIVPEVEVRDVNEGTRFLDFAYISDGKKMCFEIDGYGPHARDIDRRKFADDRMRQNHLVLDGWTVIRFSYDDVREHPRRCQRVIQLLFGIWAAHSTGVARDSRETGLRRTERLVLEWARKKIGLLSPVLAAQELGISPNSSRRVMRSLYEKQLLERVGEGVTCIRRYRYRG